MRRREYWLVTTQHLPGGLLFKDDNDFCVGMNYVAVFAHKCNVRILSFVLMSNHLHFVLEGSREQAALLVECFKREYSRHLNKKYGDVEVLRRNRVGLREVSEYGDELLRAISYVQMNPVAANICAISQDYPWGTGNVFFSMAHSADCRVIADMSSRERYRVLHSKADVPGGWMVCPQGYVLPASYVDVEFVEHIFMSPKRMTFYLHSSSKAKQRLERSDDGMPAFSDQAIWAVLPDLFRSVFRKSSVKELKHEELVELVRQLRFRFSAGASQIVRVTGLSAQQVEACLDSM